MNWSITQINTIDEPNSPVAVASFRVSDGTSSIEDDAVMPIPSLEHPLESASEEQVVGWVKSTLTPAGVEQYEALVTQRTNAAQPVAVPLSWNS